MISKESMHGTGRYLIIHHLLRAVVLLQRRDKLDDVRVVRVELVARAVKAKDEATMFVFWGYVGDRASFALVLFVGEKAQVCLLRAWTGDDVYSRLPRADSIRKPRTAIGRFACMLLEPDHGRVRGFQYMALERHRWDGGRREAS